MTLGKFNPEIARQIDAGKPPREIMADEKPKNFAGKLKRFLLYLALVAITAAVTSAFWYYNDSYDRCILRNVHGVPANAVYLVRDACEGIDVMR